MNTWGRRILGTLQIAGGSTGLATAVGALASGASGAGEVFAAVMVSSMSMLSIVAGVMVFENRPRGLQVSKIVQAMQVPVLSSPMISYHLVLGLAVIIRVGETPGFHLYYGDTFSFLVFAGHEFSVGLNLIAVGLYLYLRRYSLREEARTEMSSAGVFD